MDAFYQRSFPITSSEVDVHGDCRPAALLSFFQDLATDHAAALHMDRDYLMADYHAIWMLVRVWYRLSRPLRMGEEVTIRTWHRGAGGLIVYRDFDLYVDGVPVGEAVSAWVVADVESRKMLRPGSVQNIAMSPVPDTVKDKQLRLIRAPKDRRFIYTKTIRFSDLDINGHMNNTKYADVMLDALTPEELKDRFIAELQLNYSRECLAGEAMDIARVMGEDSCYIDGCSADGTRRFETILQFRPREGNPLDAGGECE